VVSTRETLLDLVGDFLRIEGTFVIDESGERSYRDVANAAKALASRFRAARIEKGDKVVIWSENRAEWIVALYACLLAGVVAVPVDYRSSGEFAARVGAITGAKLLLHGAEVKPASEMPAWPLDQIEWPSGDAAFETAPAIRSDVCQIIFTSGATAEPKGVMITHGNLLANLVPVEQEIGKYRRYAGIFQPLRILNLLPMSHLFGQVMAAFIPPMVPLQVIFMRSVDPGDIVRQIRSRRISVVVAVPMILSVLATYVKRAIRGAAIERQKKVHWLRRWWAYRDLHRAFGWKFWAFVTGGAPLDAGLEIFWGSRGYLVVQGYGLTETAPIVTLNHPFHASRGSVGTPVAGVEVRIAPDGEVLVRGGNVTPGYFGGRDRTAMEDGWLHTGDIGSIDERGRLHIRGRKKEMIVTPEGLNVFPEDVERALNRQPGVRESAVIGDSRPHAVLVLERGADPAKIVRLANAQLETHQQIRQWTVWPETSLPRTEGTQKLKRREIQDRVAQGAGPTGSVATLEDLGLSSLERVELQVRMEQSQAPPGAVAETVQANELITFPRWSLAWPARAVRRVALPLFLLPLARVFARVRAIGRENLPDAPGAVVFASNHQSYFDLPVILMALPSRYRYRVATAMSRDFFRPYFHPEGQRLWTRFRFGLGYFLACLVFNAFPLPQREAGARESLQYMTELLASGWSVLIFPEGKMTDAGEIATFQPGVGLIAGNTGAPVVPVRLFGVDRVLHRKARWPSMGKVDVGFGKAMTFGEQDYAEIARRIEEAVRRLFLMG
jgi:long-chain acyl-CoA synthetase